MMGFSFSQPRPDQIPTLASLIATSCCLYLSGMVLNDVFDYEVDRKERPDRPIPSGEISRRRATAIGFGLLSAGVTIGWLTRHTFLDPTVHPWRAGTIATALALAVLLYDGVLKNTRLGPLAMGTCRFLNVLLGMSAAPQAMHLLDFAIHEWMVAGGMGIFVTGITMFARHESGISRRGQLVAALCVMVTGVAMLATFPMVTGKPLRLTHPLVWPALVFILTLPVWRHAATALQHLGPIHVQRTVKTSIMTLIVLNAGICLASPGPFSPLYALGVPSLADPVAASGSLGVLDLREVMKKKHPGPGRRGGHLPGPLGYPSGPRQRAEEERETSYSLPLPHLDCKHACRARIRPAQAPPRSH